MTAAAFVEIDGQPFFRTGDVAEVVRLVGRKDGSSAAWTVRRIVQVVSGGWMH